MPKGGKREGAGRPKKSSLSPLRQQQIKDEINAKSILRRLHGLVMGQVEMSSAAVTAAGILLRKVLPDLQAVEHSGQLDTTPVAQLTDEQLDTGIARAAALISQFNEGEKEAPSDPSKLN